MAGKAAPQLRILLGSAIAIGPGKAELLDAIERCGSISAAARAMGMSYRRAWLLADTMNRCFRSGLVDAAPGGRRGGGAVLTDLGREVLARYRAMEATAAASLADEMADFRRLLHPAAPGGPPPSGRRPHRKQTEGRKRRR